MLPPEGIVLKRGQSPTISITVPDRSVIEELAEEFHSAGIAANAEVLGWPVTYRPSNTRTERLTFKALFTGEEAEVEDIEIHTPSEFQMGSYETVWYVGCMWSNGDDQPPRWFDSQDDG